MSLAKIFCRCASTFRIACASGFWGDTAVSTPQLVYGKPNVDFIVYDYLSEITMSLLVKARSKDERLGYCPDFIQMHMAPYIQDIKKRGIKIVSNAGGINPIACAESLKQVAASKNVADLNIAVVTGDDLMSQKETVASALKDESIPANFQNSVASMNAYFGAGAIKAALDAGADVVITGRCVDSALALGPLMHKFSWKESEYDRLALGSLGGHLIECGAQCTGGIYTDWRNIPDWHNIGFPIIEFEENCNDEFLVTKPKGTGGRVSFGTVAEQLVYEIADPESYLLPDVTVDFSNVQISDTGTNDSVLVKGANGKAPSDLYKVSATYLDGYRCTAVSTVVGRDADEKARKTAEAIITRCRTIFKKLNLDDFLSTKVSVIGANESYPHGSPPRQPRTVFEASLWLAVEHKQRQALELFAREIAPAGTGMAPGLTNIVGGRPRASPILKLFSFMVPKAKVQAEVFLNGKHLATYKPSESTPASADSVQSSQEIRSSTSDVTLTTGNCAYRLEQLAYLRSGDKGDTCNIGIVCRKPEYYPYLERYLTADVVATFFEAHFVDSTAKNEVKRYLLPGICGFNFVLPNVLGGGGIASLRFDPQGKGFAQMLCEWQLSGLPSLDEM